MLYTVGHTSSYHRYFRENGTPKKLGRAVLDGSLYTGGTVWETEQEARRYCPLDYSVFGVVAQWGIDTYFVDDPESYPRGAHALLRSAPLVRLDVIV